MTISGTTINLPIFWFIFIIELVKIEPLRLLFTLIICGILFPLGAQTIQLTEAEESFLKEHPVIRLGGDPSLEPYLIANPDGTYSGIEKDILNRIQELSGLKIEIVGGLWQEVVKMAQERQIDGLMTSAARPSRRPYFNFTDEYAAGNVVFYRRASDTTSFDRLQDFDGKRLGLQSGNQMHHDLLAEFNNPHVTDYPSVAALVAALINGEVDYVMSGGALTYYLSNYGLMGVKLAYVARETRVPWVYSIRKDWPEAVSIFNKALAQIPAEERRRMLGKWLLDLMVDEPVSSTAARERLQEMDTLSIGLVSDWPPFCSEQDGVALGILPDYYREINQHLNLQLDFQFFNGRSELRQALKSGQVDIIVSSSTDSAASETIAFHSFPLALVAKRIPYTLDIGSLKDQKVGVVSYSPYKTQIFDTYQSLDLVEVRTIDEGILQVENGDLDGFIAGLPLISHRLRLYDLTELKIAGVLPIKVNLRSQTKDPVVAEVLNQAHLLLPTERIGELVQGRGLVQPQKKSLADYKWFWWVVGGFLLLLALIFVWNRSLARQIEKRKRIEEKLLASQASLTALIESTSSRIYSLNREYRLVTFNTNFFNLMKEMTGVEVQKGDDIVSLIPETWREVWRRRYAKALEGKSYDVTDRDKVMDANRYFQTFFNPIRLNGEIVGVSCFATDITEVTRLNQIMVGLLRHSTDFVYVKDRDHKFLAASDSLALAHGFSDGDELFGKTDFDLHPQELAQGYFDREEPILSAGEEMTSYQDEYVDKDGEKWVESNKRPLRDSQGDIVGLIGITRDVTDRKRLETELREARDAAEQANLLKSQYIRELKGKQNELLVLNWFADSAPIGLGMADLESDTIVFVNPAYLRLVGETNEREVIGRNILDYLGKPERNIFLNTIKPAIEREGFWKGERKMKAKDGSTVYTYEHYFLLRGEDGAPIALANVVSDITERRKMEADLREKQKEADRANRAKSAFLANMSHEIRTPLNSIIGFSDLLNQMVTEELHQSYLQAIAASGKTLLALINDILDISKIESGKFEIRQVPLNLKSLAEEIRSMFAIRARERHLDFEVNVDNPISEYLFLDELRIKQILINLLGNSFKFTNEGGVFLTIRVLAGTKNSYNLEFEVKDTGIGISASAKDRIFHNFYQDLDRPGSGAHGGTGLGLAIVQKLVKLMGGSISVESEVDKGTVFRLMFPQITIVEDAQAIKERLQEHRPEDVLFESSSVLLVDDIDNNRFYLRELFRNTAILVWEARDGVEALEILARESIDLVLTDIRMPKMDGFGLATELKKSDVTADIPIVAVTASVFGTDSHLKDLFDGILYKPVLRYDLIQLLKRYIPHQRMDDHVTAKEPGVAAFTVTEEMRKIIAEELGPAFAELREQQPIGEVLAFAKKLQQIQLADDGETLRDFGKRLESAVHNLDIASMLDQLRSFDNMMGLQKIEGDE